MPKEEVSIELIENILTSHLKNLLSATDSIYHSEITERYQKLLEKLKEQGVLKTTSVVVGLENIKKFWVSMIQQTKSTITITTPWYQFLPIEAIKNIQWTARVTIFTYVNPKNSKDQDFLRDLYEKDHIRIRNVESWDFTFLSARRDAEEAISALVNPKSSEDELIGIASQVEEFNDFFYLETIEAYLLARSREIRRADVDL